MGTLVEAFEVFDVVRAAYDPAWAAGIPYCCGLPVTMDSHDGRTRIYCLRCGRTIQKLAGQWVVAEWGSRGIKMARARVQVDMDRFPLMLPGRWEE